MTSIVIRILLITLTTATFAYHTEARATEAVDSCRDVQGLCDQAKQEICGYTAESVSVKSRLENAIEEYIDIHRRNKFELERELEAVILHTQSIFQTGVPKSRFSSGLVRQCTRCLGSNETNINYFGPNADNALFVAEGMMKENNNLVARLFETATKSLEAVKKVRGPSGLLIGSGEQAIANDLSRILLEAQLDSLEAPVNTTRRNLACPQEN